MRRTAANLLATIHAGLELWVVYLLIVGPLHLGGLALVVVGLPMVILRGRCWLTSLESVIRGRRTASMTRRLIHWGTFGLVQDTRRWQWWVMYALFGWWLARIFFRSLGF